MKIAGMATFSEPALSPHLLNGWAHLSLIRANALRRRGMSADTVLSIQRLAGCWNHERTVPRETGCKQLLNEQPGTITIPVCSIVTMTATGRRRVTPDCVSSRLMGTEPASLPDIMQYLFSVQHLVGRMGIRIITLPVSDGSNTYGLTDTDCEHLKLLAKDTASLLDAVFRAREVGAMMADIVDSVCKDRGTAPSSQQLPVKQRQRGIHQCYYIDHIEPIDDSRRHGTRIIPNRAVLLLNWWLLTHGCKRLLIRTLEITYSDSGPVTQDLMQSNLTGTVWINLSQQFLYILNNSRQWTCISMQDCMDVRHLMSTNPEAAALLISRCQ